MRVLLFLLAAVLGLGCSQSHFEVRTLGPDLKEVVFTDYDLRLSNEVFDRLGELLKSAPQSEASSRAPGCSGVVAGQFFGRTYDWMFSSADEYVIRVPAREGRHASLGVTTGGLLDPQQVGGMPLTDEQKMALLPYCTLDGVNDAGLVVSDNIVPHGDHGLTTGTCPGAPRVNELAFVRYLLDRCATVKEAIELARTTDIFSIPVLELHYLVLDATGASCVIEIVDNKVVILENPRVMTNFYLYDYLRDGTHTPHAEGIERYRTLEKGRSAVKSVADMVRLMSRVHFSLYVKPGNERAWWSELNGYENPFRDEFPQSPERFHLDDERTFAQAAAARMKMFAAERESLNKAQSAWRETGEIPKGILAWVSVHTSVYDAKNKTLELRILENADAPYHLSLKEN